MTELDEMTPEQRADFERHYHDLPWYAANAPLMVLDKNSTQMVPFRFNIAQKYTTARLWNMVRQERPVRAVIPKFRQGGMTTKGLGRFVHIGNTRADRMMVLMLHDLELAEPMYDRMMMMHRGIGQAENVTEGGVILPRARITTDKKGSAIGFDTGSLIQIMTAGKQGGLGRGNTVHHVHATEIPSWGNPAVTMKGIQDAVPELLGFESSIILESTSEGVGDWWYWTCMKAAEGRGIYELIFLPWWIELAYGASDPRPIDLKHIWTPGGDRDLASCLKEPLSVDEQELAKQILREAPSYGITFLTPDMVVAKLLWRRRKIDGYTDDPLATFMQEYPATLRESFQGSGKPVFNGAAIQYHRTRKDDAGADMVCDAPLRLEIEKVDTIMVAGAPVQRWRHAPSESGSFHVWKGFERGARYIIGGDPASGEGDDPSAIQVCRVTPQTFEQVAVWHGWIGMVALAHITAHIAQMYGGRALIVPEITGIGQEYVDTLVTLRWPGRKIYRRMVLDARNKRMVDKFGFSMNEQTRNGVIEQLKELLPTPGLVLRHEKTIMELEQFRRDPKQKTAHYPQGRPDHPAGGHSDLLMALGGAAYARFEDTGPKARSKTTRGVSYEASNGGASGRGVILGRDGSILTSVK